MPSWYVGLLMTLIEHHQQYSDFVSVHCSSEWWLATCRAAPHTSSDTASKQGTKLKVGQEVGKRYFFLTIVIKEVTQLIDAGRSSRQ